MFIKGANANPKDLATYLKPELLPQTISYALPEKQGYVSCELRDAHIYFAFAGNQSAPPSSQIIPIWEFKAILAKTIITKNGIKAIVLTLWHSNKKYHVPLLISRSLVAIATYWKAWAHYYNLPMILKDSQNRYITVSANDSLVDVLLKNKEKAIVPVKISSLKIPLGLKISFKKQVFSA